MRSNGVAPGWRPNWVSPGAQALPITSDAAEPVPGPTFGVGHCQDADLVLPNEEDERVREAGEQGSSDLEGWRLRLEAAERNAGAFR